MKRQDGQKARWAKVEATGNEMEQNEFVKWICVISAICVLLFVWSRSIPKLIDETDMSDDDGLFLYENTHLREYFPRRWKKYLSERQLWTGQDVDVDVHG